MSPSSCYNGAMRHGIIKVATASPALKLADPMANIKDISALMEAAEEKRAKVLTLPRLAVTGASCKDLFLSTRLIDAAWKALKEIAASSKGKDVLTFVGCPVRKGSNLYDAIAAVKDGEILALSVNNNLRNSERRWFSTYYGENIELDGVPFGTDFIFTFGDMKIAPVTDSELYSLDSQLGYLALNGVNLFSVSGFEMEHVTSFDRNTERLKAESYRTKSAILLSYSSEDESTSDGVACGMNGIAEVGDIVMSREESKGYIMATEIDLGKIMSIRRHDEFRKDSAAEELNEIEVSFQVEETKITRQIFKWPFLADCERGLAKRSEKILDLQARALKRRVEHTNAKKLVVGLSGGLDSTLALLVACRAMDMLRRPRADVLAITMPCFGTTSRTKSNAQLLAEQMHCSFEEIDIKKSVMQHFEDIGHDPEDLSVTYENSQARERTQVLMDKANKLGGMVVGTGDLSELALGWATYNGDHMSMYSVNGSVPKTLVRTVVENEASKWGPASKTLYDILDTPVSPELLPAENGEIAQQTEDIVGPYDLHDFFLYYVVKYGYSEDKILRLATRAFRKEFDEETIRHWLTVFMKRFTSQQFKRNCLPDGPSIGSISFSPRGDWEMPADAFLGDMDI